MGGKDPQGKIDRLKKEQGIKTLADAFKLGLAGYEALNIGDSGDNPLIQIERIFSDDVRVKEIIRTPDRDPENIKRLLKLIEDHPSDGLKKIYNAALVYDNAGSSGFQVGLR